MSAKTNIRFDRKITVETTTETQNAYGELTDSWATHKEVYAHMEDQAGIEKYSAGRETAFGKTIFLIRYDSSITEKMRVNFESRIYDIISLEEITRRRYLRIITELRE